MRQFKPLPGDTLWASTLSSRIVQLREIRNITTRDLAKLSGLPVKRIEDLEAGLETWLSATDRQMLARALCIEPALLQEVEFRPPSSIPLNHAAAEELIEEEILSGARDLHCPRCGSSLKCSVQDALDIEGRPIQFAKAYCVKCPYVL